MNFYLLTKKRICLVFLFLMLISHLVSQTLPANKNRPIFVSKINLNYPIQKYFNNMFLAVSTDCDIIFNKTYTSLSASFGGQQNSFVVDIIHTLLAKASFNLGAAVKTHVTNFQNIFTETNFLTGIFFCRHKSKKFFYQLRFDLMFKFTRIYSLPVFIKKINYDFTSFFHWQINRYIQPFFSISTSELFDYPLFGTSFFSFGCESCITDSITAGAEYKTAFTDMFSVSNHISQSSINLFAKVKF